VCIMPAMVSTKEYKIPGDPMKLRLKGPPALQVCAMPLRRALRGRCRHCRSWSGIRQPRLKISALHDLVLYECGCRSG
jgi:hypothetical protein